MELWRKMPIPHQIMKGNHLLGIMPPSFILCLHEDQTKQECCADVIGAQIVIGLMGENDMICIGVHCVTSWRCGVFGSF